MDNISSYNSKKEVDRKHPKLDRKKIMKAAQLFIEAIGDDITREGLVGTLDRVARAAEELFEGMNYTNDEIAQMYNTCFKTNTKGLVTEVDIPIFSTCEHHLMLMYDMKVSVGYIPKDGRVIGLSKMARICEMCGHRIGLQEKIGEDIADVMRKVLETNDVIVVINGKHSCMTARGAKSNAITKTATLSGRFETNSDLRAEFYSIIKK